MPDKRISAASKDPLELKSLDTSLERGFLPAVDPTLSRPADLAPWQELGAELWKRLLAGRVASAADRSPRFATQAFQTDRHRRFLATLGERRHPLYVLTRETSRRNRIHARAMRGKP